MIAMNKNQRMWLLPRLMELKHRSSLVKPLCRLALKSFFSHIRLHKPEDYFAAVTRSCGIVPRHSLSHYRNELLNDKLLKETYTGAIAAGKQKQKYADYEQRFHSVANIVHYYALLRELLPEYVIETGTATGSMTSWVLKALHENGRGRLISIDLPPIANRLTMDITVAPEEVGFLIPKEYRKQWDLRVGDAKVLLPKTLLDIPADVFIHDSLHTTTHMSFEYHTARALLKPNAVILSDDILWNRSWYQFLKTHNLKGLSCEDNANLGFTINRFDDFEKAEGLGVIEQI
jgi:hypothetical protein